MKLAIAFVFGLCAVLATGVWAEDAKGPGKKGAEGKGPRAGARRPGGPGGPGGAGGFEAMKEQMLKRFDKDGDGKLSEEERAAAMKERGGRPGGPGAAGRGPGGRPGPGGPGGPGKGRRPDGAGAKKKAE